jgi:hypothetical protein
MMSMHLMKQEMSRLPELLNISKIYETTIVVEFAHDPSWWEI